jgi:pimeloyl-ACP methyl ester carboxylesterase
MEDPWRRKPINRENATITVNDFIAYRFQQIKETIMAAVAANGIQIEYETFGKQTEPPLLLIAGLSCQLIHWDEAICEQLARRGHYVIRFDNRDCGLSSKLSEAGTPDIGQFIEKQMKGEKITPPYTFEDMAADAVGLLDALSIKAAHICGFSMGGMIAQTIAINYPTRALSLISIYSHTGNPGLPPPKPEAAEILFTPPPAERQAYIAYILEVYHTFSGSGFPVDEEWIRNIAAQAYDRAFCPQGVVRQFAAIITQKNRKMELGSLTVPTLVIHGSDDPLVPLEGGQETAAAIPGAELVIIEGMGHDLPHDGGWPQIISAIVAHTRKAANSKSRS